MEKKCPLDDEALSRVIGGIGYIAPQNASSESDPASSSMAEPACIPLNAPSRICNSCGYHEHISDSNVHNYTTCPRCGGEMIYPNA